MHILGIVGADATTLCERLATRLDGRVATLESLPDAETDDEPPSGVDAAYGISPNGQWVAAGDERPLDELIDDLAARYDYLLLSGFADAGVPTLALGGADARNVVAEAANADAVEFDEVRETIDSLEPHITLGTLIERVKADSRGDYAGAIATFTGRVRAKESEDDVRTTSLEFEKYDGVAEARMDTISEELESRDGVERVLMYHRVGVIGDGEDIVFVVVLAGHRTEAFRTVEDGINRLKDEVPIFKKETTVEEQFWKHER
ncbi:molybdopterin synthase [Haloferax sp. DFSO60]|uniref:molybdopterin synthase n=1 Tax=Haloferax sp. DFSO60 TaxID=3388652 RepID=UPI0039787734